MTPSQWFIDRPGWLEGFRPRNLSRSWFFWIVAVLVGGGLIELQAEDNYDLLVISHLLPVAAILAVYLSGARIIRQISNRSWREELALSGIRLEENFTPNAIRWFARPFLICAAGEVAAHLYSGAMLVARRGERDSAAESIGGIFLSLMANLSLGAVAALVCGIGLSRLLAGYLSGKNERLGDMGLGLVGSVFAWVVLSVGIPVALPGGYVMLLRALDSQVPEFSEFIGPLVGLIPTVEIVAMVLLARRLRTEWGRTCRRYFEFE